MSTVESIARPRRNGERRRAPTASISKESPAITGVVDRKSGSAGMPRPISYAVFCLKKKKKRVTDQVEHLYLPTNAVRSATQAPRRLKYSIHCSVSDLLPPSSLLLVFFFFNDTATTEIYTLSLHDALPILSTVESIARPRRNGERRRAPTASISKESPAITGVVEMVIRRPI